jgi:flavin-dependent dehydrogenase
VSVDAASRPELFEAARFDFGFPDDGYAWVFPKREHLSIGCLSARRGARGLRATLEQYLAHLGLGTVHPREDHGHAIPAGPRSRILARDGVLLVGDAAGLVDPVTCEGLANAVHSGALAAQAIAASPEDPAQVHAAYHRALEREILRELRLARALARLVYRSPRLRRTLFRRFGQPLCEAMADVVAGRQSYRGLALEIRSYRRLLGAMRGRRDRGSRAASLSERGRPETSV